VREKKGKTQRKARERDKVRRKKLIDDSNKKEEKKE